MDRINGRPIHEDFDEDAVSDFIQEPDAVEIKDRHGDWIKTRETKPKTISDEKPKFKSRRKFIKKQAYLKSLGLDLTKEVEEPQ